MAHKITTKAAQGLYEYDAVRLRLSTGESKVHDISNYIVKGKLWKLLQPKVSQSC